jgi:hypothetical protein
MQALLDITAERVPGADLIAADLEDPLPYAAGQFNVVTVPGHLADHRRGRRLIPAAPGQYRDHGSRIEI